MTLLDTFKEKAKANKRKIVLPEGNELRTMKGAVIAAQGVWQIRFCWGMKQKLGRWLTKKALCWMVWL